LSALFSTTRDRLVAEQGSIIMQSSNILTCDSPTAYNRYPKNTMQSKVSGHTKRRRNEGTARSVIRPMEGRRVGLITAAAIQSSVPSGLQRTKTSTLYFIYPHDTSSIQLRDVASHPHRKQVFRRGRSKKRRDDGTDDGTLSRQQICKPLYGPSQGDETGD